MNEQTLCCQNCGATITPQYKFCGNCGLPVNTNSSVSDSRATVQQTPENTPNPQIQKPYFCYARYISKKGEYLRFQESDESFIGMPERLASRLGRLQVKKYYWLRVIPKEGGKKHATLPPEEQENKYLEYISFASRYKENDRLVLPIKSIGTTYCSVMIGPNASVGIKREEIDQSFKSSDLKPGNAYIFTVRKIEKVGGKYNIELEFCGSSKMKNVEYQYKSLPDSIADVVIHYKNIELIVNDPTKREVFEHTIGTIDKANLASLIEKEYQQQKRDKTLVIHYDNQTIYINIDLGIKDTNGVPINACVNRRREKDKFVLSLIGGVAPTSEMERFVYVPDWDNFCRAAADIALPEKWGYDDGDNYSILESYLKMTYYKARLDGLLVETDNGALFNTGLVDSAYDEIYCYLQKTKSVDDPYEREWTPGFFACRGKGVNGKRLNSLFTSFPPVPTYINLERIEHIYFDTRKELFCDYSHILEDNLRRLPEEFITQTLAYDSNIRKWSDQHGTAEEIKEYVLSKPELLKALEDQLKTAVDTAIKYCKWNYKTAIPIYYPRTNNISLLLPLSVVKGSETVDTALVIELLPNGNYQGQTILTLDMAYMDARQICRPNSEWLTLDAVEYSVHSEDMNEDD